MIDQTASSRPSGLSWLWHWLVVIGLGTVWILDGLEVTIVGSMSDALKPSDTGLGMNSFQIGFAGAAYVAGACIGALFFGHLTDRLGRKKLFFVTLAVGLTIPLGYEMLSRERPLVQDGCDDSRNSLMWQAICGVVIRSVR